MSMQEKSNLAHKPPPSTLVACVTTMLDTPPRIAVAAQVPHIVTFNAKYFRPAARFGIDVITPIAVLIAGYRCISLRSISPI